MKNPHLARSALFVPATRPDRITKALSSQADAVIVDLEDAVAPQDKDSARAAMSAALQFLSPSRSSLWVRINSQSPWYASDLAACASLQAVDAIMVPKAETTAQMNDAQARSGGKPLVALIESAAGFAQRDALAAHPAVQRLAFGTIDFQHDLGIAGDGQALLMFRSALVLTCRLSGRPGPLDGVTVDLRDTQRVAADASAARELGFGGKLCIHPQQVATVNAAFSASPEQLQWAERVVRASQAAAGAAVAVDGTMVDRPVLLRAQALLAQRD